MKPVNVPPEFVAAIDWLEEQFEGENQGILLLPAGRRALVERGAEEADLADRAVDHQINLPDLALEVLGTVEVESLDSTETDPVIHPVLVSLLKVVLRRSRSG